MVQNIASVRKNNQRKKRVDFHHFLNNPLSIWKCARRLVSAAKIDYCSFRRIEQKMPRCIFSTFECNCFESFRLECFACRFSPDVIAVYHDYMSGHVLEGLNDSVHLYSYNNAKPSLVSKPAQNRALTNCRTPLCCCWDRSAEQILSTAVEFDPARACVQPTDQTMPCSSIASATFRKPAIFAPST